jgi:hypothetical protein
MNLKVHSLCRGRFVIPSHKVAAMKIFSVSPTSLFINTMIRLGVSVYRTNVTLERYLNIARRTPIPQLMSARTVPS